MIAYDHFAAVHKQGEVALNAMAADATTMALATKALNACQDIEAASVAIKDRPETLMIKLGIKEYNLSLCQVSIANYRQAYAGLRLSAELLLCSIYFSAHEIKYHKWRAGSEDIIWRSVIDRESGIFSSDFISTFNKDFVEHAKSYLSMAEKAYRECSEYVHGNMKTSMDMDLVYSPEILKDWIDKADTILLAFFYAFAARHILFLDEQGRQKIESIMLDNFGHLPAVQQIYA